MADTKLSGLTALAAGGQAAGDLIELMDVSDTTMSAAGTNKKMTMTAFLGGLPADLLFTQDNPEILGGDTDGVFILGAGATNILGGSIRLYGDTHASKAQDIEFYADATLVLSWDESESNWDFAGENVKGIGTLASGALTVTGAATISTTLQVGITSGLRAKLDVVVGTHNTAGDTAHEAIIVGASHATNLPRGQLTVQSNDAQGADLGGQIVFGGRYIDSQSDGANFAVISGRKENSTSNNLAGYFTISTRNTSSTMTPALTIDSGQNAIFATSMKVIGLAGSGSRAVVVDANGLMSAP